MRLPTPDHDFRQTLGKEADHTAQPPRLDHELLASRTAMLSSTSSPESAQPPRRRQRALLPKASTASLLFYLVFLYIAQAHAAFVEFSNCLDSGTQTSDRLQFVPLYVNASFDVVDESHLINITIFGNVTGQTFEGARAPFDSPEWNNPNYTVGKIVDTTTQPNGSKPQSGLVSSFRVLSYEPVSVPAQPFCESLRGGTKCPVGPVFNLSDITAADALSLRSFGFQVPLNSSYRFTTIDSTFRVYGADLLPPNDTAQAVACVAVSITPELGPSISGILRYLPVAILVLVAAATVSAAVMSPWGTSNPFKWTSNYGRDEDLLRLVTPGFGDCLQYIQFVFLSGALTLNYPGFFRPVVSNVNWSALMFNESFVSQGRPFANPSDGVYVTHADYYGGEQWNLEDEHERHDYGMTRLRQLTGLAADEDIWAGTVIWLLVIIAAVIVICQLFFFARWLLRTISHQPEEDLRSKNWPFTGGMLVRLVCNYFLLPLTAVSFFQLVVAADSEVVVVVFAVILLVAILAFAGWILKIIFSSKPRSHLFDDLPTVLLYGPLYNTYSDDAALFALIPALLTFIRAIAIGAVQPSGIAQIVILAVCEVVFVLTLHAFRPFRRQTSMNAYHTFFAVTRLIIILLSVTFVPSLNVDEPTKGWIAYVILLLHAIVLVFGYLLNAIQTLIEVIARYSGAGADETTGAATRGTFVKVFGKRQLTRRRRRPGLRNSLNSDAAMLTDDADALENKSAAYGGRSRSLSASSAILLNQRTPERLSSHLDRAESGSAGRDTSAENSTYAALYDVEAGPSTRPDVVRPEQGAAPFYRAPRQRRPTGDLMTPGQRSRGSWAGVESSGAGPSSPERDKRESAGTIGKAISMSPEGKAAPVPAYMRQREGSDPTLLNDPNRTDVDYAVREVDFYYNVRGPRLNDQPTRQLKTGPADPVGPVSSATGWFKTMFGRKSKEQSKGFEVVRSSRAPPERLDDDLSPDVEPYQDNPQPVNELAVLPGQRTRSNEEDREQALAGAEEESRGLGDKRISGPVSPLDSSFDGRDSSDVFQGRPSGLSDLAPSLEPIDAGSSIHVPSRYNSSRTGVPSRLPSTVDRDAGGAMASDGGPQLLPPIDAGSSIHMPSRFNSRATTVQRQASTAEQYGQAGARGQVAQQDGSYRAVTPPARVPFTAPLSPIAGSGRNSLGAESVLSMERDMLNADGEPVIRNVPGGLSVPLREERPSSTGYVHQHRIADRITQGTPELEFAEAHEAEVVNGGSKRSARSSMGFDGST